MFNIGENVILFLGLGIGLWLWLMLVAFFVVGVGNYSEAAYEQNAVPFGVP